MPSCCTAMVGSGEAVAYFRHVPQRSEGLSMRMVSAEVPPLATSRRRKRANAASRSWLRGPCTSGCSVALVVIGRLMAGTPGREWAMHQLPGEPNPPASAPEVRRP